MDNSTKNDIPWELIGNSLTGTLTVDEELQLKQWLSSNPANDLKYSQILDLWKNGLEDYTAYKEADENKSWKVLNLKMGINEKENTVSPIVDGQFTHKPAFLRKWIAVAAVFLGVVSVGLWLVLSVRKPLVYETLAHVEKKVVLKDGSVITLKPLTKIEVLQDFDETKRAVVMVVGEAYFEVVHRADKPFTVEVGKTLVKDIGTSFTIRKGSEEIHVAVTSGKVEFKKLSTNETRELSAGTNVTFDVQSESFGEIKDLKTTVNAELLLNFDNTLLSDAVVSIQKVFEKKIVLADVHIANRKITAHLEGMPFNTVINVICKSLNLEYTVNDSIYILKERK